MFMLYVAVFFAIAVLPCSTPEYPWKDSEALTCDICPLGMFVGTNCSRDMSTQCLPCGKSQYTEFRNYLEWFLCKDSTFDYCLRHTVCPPGEGVRLQTAGTRERDMECELCEEGFFSNVSSSTAACQTHSVCADNQTLIPGDDIHDTFCSSCRANSVQPQDIKVCNQEMVRFVLGRLHSGRLTQRLLRALRRVNRGSADLELSELLDVLVGKKSPSGLEVLLDALDQARLPHLHRLVTKWFSAQGSV